MLGTRITSFAFGFACASGISMYKLKEEIWSSHKILADQVRPLTRVAPDRRTPPPRPDPTDAPTIGGSDRVLSTRVLRARPMLTADCPASRPPTAVRRDRGPAVQAGDDDVQAVSGAGDAGSSARERRTFSRRVVDSCVVSPPAVS